MATVKQFVHDGMIFNYTDEVLNSAEDIIGYYFDNLGYPQGISRASIYGERIIAHAAGVKKAAEITTPLMPPDREWAAKYKEKLPRLATSIPIDGRLWEERMLCGFEASEWWSNKACGASPTDKATYMRIARKWLLWGKNKDWRAHAND